MRNNERGQVLISATTAVALVLFALLAALTITQYSGKLTYRQLLAQGQATNVAQAGLIEGLSWFRNQPAQPVTTFAPQRNTSVVPVINETETTSVGLVRTFQLSTAGRVWGRYELRRTADPTTNTLDISRRRGKATNGALWQLESIGAVFVRNSNSAAYNVAPNTVLAQRTLRAEIQRLGYSPPVTGALVVNRGDAVNVVNTDVRLVGGTSGTGLSWVAATNSPGGAGYGTPPNTQIDSISGGIQSAPTQPSAPDRFSIPYIFGVTEQELINMANYVTNDINTLPATIPPWSLIVLRDPADLTRNYQFTGSRPLTGSGVLVVFGTLTIAMNSNSLWNGVIYVKPDSTTTGNAYQQIQPSTVNGMVIVNTTTSSPTQQNVVLQGSGEKSTIRYDPGLMSFLTTRMGLYNFSRPPYIPCSSGPSCF